MTEIKEEIKTVSHNTVHPKDETDREARKRQPWMPILGAIVSGAILFAVYVLFF